MKTLLQKTFGNKFEESNYKDLIINLFNRFDFSKEHSLRNQFNEAERQALNDFTYLGTFEDMEKKKLDVLIVELRSGSKVERARSLQRNLIGKFLKTNLNDAALVAFYSKDNSDWRLSFVKMEYKITEKGVKVDIGTPPKRYSFLVGKYEPSHTAQKQLVDLLDEKKLPKIDELENSFSIEKVTKEFYSQVALMFTELVGGERKIGAKKIIEKGSLKLPSTNDDTVKKEFAVRLIGRLLFCWFLKKKKSEAGESLIPLSILSYIAITTYPNYYHSLLEPLFFQVLNTPIDNRNKRVKNDFWNKIPFLNGGLFEPHQHDFYDVDELGTSKYLNTLRIPDDWFSELFEIFEMYNFTIDESTSIDVEISVDPEMLGRIFENLLAEINPQTGETARKATGSYYTPRPIVEYMVDESLKQYLKTKTDIDEGKLSQLLSYAEDDIGITEKEKDLVIDALDNLKIIDPACGSGAFPMGILHKMLLILQKVDPKSSKWLLRKLSHIESKVIRDEAEKKLKRENWDYIHKLGIIQNSIYGVDIQPIAVEISKLRFFLSLIVDEMIDDTKSNRGIEPLPNLEFKFVAANSLIGLPKAESSISESYRDIEKLRELREAYFISYGDGKRKIENKFKDTQEKMFQYSLNWQTTQSQTYKLSEWDPFSDNTSSWFDPEWMFDVRNGFDIVIANPPYVSAWSMEKENEHMRSQLKQALQNHNILTGHWDLYIAFLVKGFALLNVNGCITYITPNAILKEKYATKAREHILQDLTLISLLEFNDVNVFEGVARRTTVFVAENRISNDNYSINLFRNINNESIQLSDKIKKEFWFKQPRHIFLIHGNINEDKLLSKLEELSHKIGNYFYVNYGVQVSSKKKGHFRKKDVVGTVYKPNSKPFYEGKDVQRWHLKNRDLWLNYRKNEMYGPRAPELFETAKIVIRKVSDKGHVIAGTLDETHRYTDDGNVIIVPYETLDGTALRNDFMGYDHLNNNISLRYALAIILSKLESFYFKKRFATESLQGATSHTYPTSVRALIIKSISVKNQQAFITLVNQILTTKQENPDLDTSALDQQLDKLVYRLYDLSTEEIEIIENYNKN